jgi:ABC-type sulfate/molybdate transport systems, ATPase component
MSLYVDIQKNFGKDSFLLNVQMEAEDTVTALLGASGSGKSMTLKCIAGIEKPDRGQIVVDGEVIFDSEKKINLSPQKRRIGYLFQNYALFPNMTVEQNIGVSLRRRVSRTEQKERTAKIIRAMYLDGLEKLYPSQLSGGQQQRAALARILISPPRVLMLDEPFSALDSYLRWQLEQEVAQILKDFPGTTLFVSHNRDEVYRLCEQVIIVDGGHVDIAGEKWELFHNPRTCACCLLTGCKNVSAARRAGDAAVYAGDWGLTFYPSGPVPEDLGFLGIRAHQFVPCDTAEPNAFPFEVVRQTEDTFSYILMVRPVVREKSTKLLRWEMDKKTYWQLNLNETPFLRVAADDLLLLSKSDTV